MEDLESKKAGWRTSHGSIAETKLGKVECVFRPPNLAEWEDIQNKLAGNAKDKAAYIRHFTKQMLLHPSGEEYETLLESYGAFPIKLFDILGEMVGGAADIIVKKG